MAALDVLEVPGFSSLVREYVHNFGHLSSYYARNPRGDSEYATLASLCGDRDYRRADLRAMLLAQQAAWDAPPVVRQRIDELCTPRGLAVCTGQQTGLFGGPFFTVYKALNTVALADRLQQTLRCPVVPLFWMASEDHDVPEADHVHMADRSGALIQVRHTAWRSPDGFMPANLRLGPAIQETLERLRTLLPATEFSDAVYDALVRAYAPDRTLSHAFAHWMTHLFGETGLVLVDAADPNLKRLAVGVFRRELEEAPRTSAAILDVSQALRASGYPAQIARRDRMGLIVSCSRGGAGRWRGTPDNILRVLDEDMNVLGSINTFGGNSFVSIYLRLQDVERTVFYIDEFGTSSNWRYRQNIVINGPVPLGNRGSGVLIAGGATNNQVIDNFISGNIENGVAIFNPGTTGNVVQENYIGTNVVGTGALGNGDDGVKVEFAALLSNDSDADGDPVVLDTVSPSSPNGAAVTGQGDWIFYQPPVGFTNVDTWSQTTGTRA